MKPPTGQGNPMGGRGGGDEPDSLEVSEHLLSHLAERFFADGDGFAAIGAKDGIFVQQGVEDHVLERIAIAQGEMRAFVEHAIEDFLDARFRRGRQPTRTARAQQFDLHDFFSKARRIVVPRFASEGNAVLMPEGEKSG